MEIVEWAALDPYRGGAFHSDNATLLACTRTSRLWHPHAQRILWRKIRVRATEEHIVYKSAFESFLRTLKRLVAQRSKLPLEATALSLGCQSAYYSTTIDLNALPTVLKLLPNLTSLHLTLLGPNLEIPDLFSFSEDQLKLLRAAPSRIQHLSVRSQISDPVILHQLLDVFRDVETLTLEAPRHSTVYADPLELPALRKLIIDQSISRKCLAYLYRTSMVNIRSLAFATLTDLSRCWMHFSQMVTDLMVLDAGWNCNDHELSLVAQFPRLERLVVGFTVPRGVLDRLPTSIKHFGFDPYMSEVDEVIDFLDGRPFIRTVGTVFHPELDDERETPERARVKSYCKTAGKRHIEVYRMYMDELPPSPRSPLSSDSDS
ncbi:hypothetical protein AURDEDRAFT_110777, partial [Auricularia subglabra TFB-10046 SS5]